MNWNDFRTTSFAAMGGRSAGWECRSLASLGTTRRRVRGPEGRAPVAGRVSGVAKGLAVSLIAASLFAAPVDGQIPAPAQSRPIALVGGTIHTVSGATIENGAIVFDDGVITAVGASVEIPVEAERIDIAGRHVWPGLIGGYSEMGLFEIGGFDVTIDVRELGSINPNVRAEVAFNPESRHIGVARSNGVLVSVSSPSGGLISGLAAAMMLDGFTWEQMLAKSSVGLIVTWPSAANEERYDEEIRELRDAFEEARAYWTAWRAGEGDGDAIRHTDLRWEAMIPVLEGEIPVVVHANELRQIQDAIAWAAEEDVSLVIRGGRDAGLIAEQLAAQRIPVLISAVIGSPGRAWEPYDAAYALPARLYEAGVPFAITGGPSAAYANRLPWEAGAAIAYGLPAEEAIRAVTLYPARFLGIDDRLGSLEVGKHATLLVTDGSPLEYATTIERIYIEGREIDRADQHRRFFEKYHDRRR